MSAAFRPPPGGLPSCVAVGGLALAEQQIVRFPLDQLAGLKAERLRARAPPAAGRLSPALAGLDVIPGRVLGRASVDLLPDVVQVITLAQGRDDCQGLLPAAGGSGTDHDRQVVHGCDAITDHDSMVTKRAIKIRNEAAR